MPSRHILAAILIYWSVAGLGLIRRDLLTELSVGNPPDVRRVAILRAVFGDTFIENPRLRFLKLRSLRFHRIFGLKGRNKSAQGIALGFRIASSIGKTITLA